MDDSFLLHQCHFHPETKHSFPTPDKTVCNKLLCSIKRAGTCKFSVSSPGLYHEAPHSHQFCLRFLPQFTSHVTFLQNPPLQITLPQIKPLISFKNKFSCLFHVNAFVQFFPTHHSVLSCQGYKDLSWLCLICVLHTHCKKWCVLKGGVAKISEFMTWWFKSGLDWMAASSSVRI